MHTLSVIHACIQTFVSFILSVRILDEDGNSFQIESIDKLKRIFRANSPVICEEWVSALKSTIKNLAEYTKKKEQMLKSSRVAEDGRFSAFYHPEDEDANIAPEVNVLLVSHVTYANTPVSSAASGGSLSHSVEASRHQSVTSGGSANGSRANDPMKSYTNTGRHVSMHAHVYAYE